MFLIRLAEGLDAQQSMLCASPDKATSLKSLVTDILSDATMRLDLQPAPKPTANQQVYTFHYVRPKILVIDPTPVTELVRVCYQTNNPTLLPAILQRIHLIIANESASDKQKCLTDLLLLPFLSQLRSVMSDQTPPVEDIPGLGDLALLAAKLHIGSLTTLPSTTQMEQLISTIALGGGATAIKTL